MCIHCRERFSQETLIRLQCDTKEEMRIINYSGTGRSFYLCNSCLDHPKLFTAFSRVCRTSKKKSQEMVATLQEKFINE